MKDLLNELVYFVPAATEGRLEAEVNVFLGVQTDQEGRNVHNLKIKNRIIRLALL
jgi:hypothetical protein